MPLGHVATHSPLLSSILHQSQPFLIGLSIPLPPPVVSFVFSLWLLLLSYLSPWLPPGRPRCETALTAISGPCRGTGTSVAPPKPPRTRRDPPIYLPTLLRLVPYPGHGTWYLSLHLAWLAGVWILIGLFRIIYSIAIRSYAYGLLPGWGWGRVIYTLRGVPCSRTGACPVVYDCAPPPPEGAADTNTLLSRCQI
jgi:hypothetical protein